MEGSPESPFQRSHQVVAPLESMYPHDGYVSFSNKRYATSVRPWSARVKSRKGVPRNPVERCQFRDSISLTSLSTSIGSRLFGAISDIMFAINAQYAVAKRSLSVCSSGASQSAKFGPTPFVLRKSGLRLRMNSIQRCMESQFLSMTSLLPYCTQVVHGTMTPASPQPGAPTIPSSILIRRKGSVLGETFVNAPCGVCASTMSCTNFCENAAMSKL